MSHPCSRLSILTFGDEFFGTLGQYIYFTYRGVSIRRKLALSHQPLANSSPSLIETTNINVEVYDLVRTAKPTTQTISGEAA